MTTSQTRGLVTDMAGIRRHEFEHLPIEDEVRPPVLRDNATRLLGLG